VPFYLNIKYNSIATDWTEDYTQYNIFYYSRRQTAAKMTENTIV